MIHLSRASYRSYEIFLKDKHVIMILLAFTNLSFRLKQFESPEHRGATAPYSLKSTLELTSVTSDRVKDLYKLNAQAFHAFRKYDRGIR